MSKKEILFWVVLSVFSFGLGFGITALVDRHNSKPKASLLNPDGLTEEQSAAQAVVVSEALSYYSKNAAANLEKALNELKTSRPIKPGQTNPAE